MADRVIPYAQANGLTYYQGVSNPEAYTSEGLLAHNAAQIDTWMSEGRTVIDIGPEPGREMWPLPTSPNYAMEQGMLGNYPGYATDVLSGESDWRVGR